MFSHFDTISQEAAKRLDRFFGVPNAVFSPHGSSARFNVAVTLRHQLVEIDPDTRAQQRMLTARFLKSSYPDAKLAGGVVTHQKQQYKLVDLLDETDIAVIWLAQKL